MMDIQQRLDLESNVRNRYDAVSKQQLDPIIVARHYNDPAIALICALFSYGNVKQIVKFLDSLDFGLLHESEETIIKELHSYYYRLQRSTDIIALFIALKRLHVTTTLEELFHQGYDVTCNVIDGVHVIMEALYSVYEHRSRGYTFLLGKITKKTRGVGALKRWMMWLRWMVRDDNIDMGLFHNVNTADLIIPLDTHTFHVSQRIGLLKRKTYDLQAAIELTQKLKEFDANDPLKYDFALYRLGQENIL